MTRKPVVTQDAKRLTLAGFGYLRRIAVVVAFATLGIPGGLLCVQQGEDSLAQAQALAFAIDSTDEGPHIFWRNDSTAYVFYLCNGEVVSRGTRVSDSLRFSGLCSDANMQYRISARPPIIEPHEFDDVPRVFTVSDIHGEFEAITTLLSNAGVIDDEGHWNWGNGHLVVLGDVFDRGDMVTECLWLIYRLEQEAESQGGRVHYLLGNHEKMAIRGDLRYVHQKYTLGISERTAIPYDDLYGPHMELGRWLRSKHTAVKLNDILFVHGGLTPKVVDRGLSLDTINQAVRNSLDYRSYQLVFSDLEWFLLSGEGPLWYRGYHEARNGYPMATAEEVGAILDFYDADEMVVGHHEVPRVQGWYENRVFGIDVPVDELGGLQALLWNDGVFYRVLSNGDNEPISHP